MITAHLIGDKIISTSPMAFSMYEKSRWGEKKTGKIEYSGTEGLYLVENRKMKVFVGNRMIAEDELLRKIKKRDKKIEQKMAIFGDLREKGYIVKTALKFGAEFRVYEKGVKPGDDHAAWIVDSVKE